MKLPRIALFLASLAAAASAQAALVTSTLSNVVILGTAYDVTFVQDDSGVTTFDQVFGAGSSPVLRFNPGNALSAASQLLAAADAAGFDVTPGSASTTVVGFQLAFSYTGSTYAAYEGWSDLDDNLNAGILGPYLSTSRGARSGLSFVTFAAARENTIPEPGSLALAGLALVGLGAARRRRG